jgi:hypothetical protein
MKGIADHHFRIKELEGLSFEWRLISVTAWECLSNLPIITNSMGTAILRTVEKTKLVIGSQRLLVTALEESHRP